MLRFKRKIESSIIALILLALGIYAVSYRGTPETDVNMNDGGVWVTNEAEGLTAHLNYQARQLDGGLNPVATSFNVSQEGNNVLLADYSGADVKMIDTATVKLSEPLAAGMSVAHGDRMVLIGSDKKKKAWALDYSSVGSFSDSNEASISKITPAGLVVTPNDHGFVTDANGNVYSLELNKKRMPVVEEIGKFAAKPADTAQYSAIGEQPVMYQNGTVYTLSGEYEIDGADDVAQLQQPSREGTTVALATARELVQINLESGAINAHAAEKEGLPAAPAVVDGCVYSAWARSGSYIKACDHSSGVTTLTNENLARMTTPQFRASRSAVVINDARGTILLPNEGMALIDDWSIIKKQIEQEDKQNEQQQESNQQEVVKEQAPPVAVDDDLGARVGVSTMLPILANDTDPNGDVLTAILQDVPEGLDVTLGEGGRSLQITLAPNQTSPVSFTYKAFDGIDESNNTATVRVTPRGENDNDAPYLNRSHTLQLAERATVTYSVLPDWIDPEGDPIFLSAATADKNLNVTFRTDGFLAITDTGTAGPRTTEVNVAVSDGKVEGTGVINVRVASAATNLPPVAYGDFYTVNAGSDVNVTPLGNDYDPNGTPLQLAQVADAEQDENVSVDYNHGRLVFSSKRVGTHTLDYSASDGSSTATSKIRIDVIDPAKVGTIPTARNDIAILPEGASATVEVLANDSDPSGKVLVVESVDVPADSGLNVQTINHEKLLISAPSTLADPQTLVYSVTNGQESARAKVIVIPKPPKVTNIPPVAVDDTATVRARDIVSIPVLNNDYSPTDLHLSIDPEVRVRSGEDLGEAFVSGDELRFKAGDMAGTAEVVYSAVDEAGNRSSARALITVRDIESGNAKPSPKPVQARAFAGQEVLIPIPLGGVDADGDSVELAQDSSKGPSMGSVEVLEGYLRYDAQTDASGTDVFTYKVKDRFKATAEATVSVGISPLPQQNSKPVAVPDHVVVKPDRSVDIPVTANDVDSDGDTITLVAGSIKAISEWNPDFTLDGDRVVLNSPHEEGNYQFEYSITDGGGVTVPGFVTVTVDETAPAQAPVAVDDRVKLADVVSRQEVEVPVLNNDMDPDGVVSDLRIEVASPARVEGSRVVVPVDGEYQVVLYKVTDADGLSSQAAIFVPGVDGVPPMLDPKKIPAEAVGAHPLEIDVNDYVIVRSGRSPKITNASTVVAARGGSAEEANNGLSVVSDTLIRFTPDKDFSGATSVTFEVHDGKTLEDPEGLRATLSLPIHVTPAVKTRPQVRPSPIDVAPGEDAVTAELSGMVSDPDEGDMQIMSYSLVKSSPEFDVKVSGSTITVSADLQTPVGTMGSAVIRVDDKSSEPVDMTIPLSVVSSPRPLMAIRVLDEPEGRVGEAKEFDVLEAITNPFADKEGEITISNARVVSGPGTVTLEESTIIVTPTDVGNIVVSYLATDATKAKDRQVTGQVTLTVKDIPLAPTGVTARSDASGTAVVDYTQGDLRGGTLESFIVRWNGGEKNCGRETNCQISGLTNNVTYSFTVVQVTEVGESQPSNSASARPDALPDIAAKPSVTPGDTQVALSWPATASNGSPVTKYKVRTLKGGAEVKVDEIAATTAGNMSHTVTGLENDQEYQFQIMAMNRYAEGDAARESEFKWGIISDVTVPVGAAYNIPQPELTLIRDSHGVTGATISWRASDINGNGDRTRNFTYGVTSTNSCGGNFIGGEFRNTTSWVLPSNYFKKGDKHQLYLCVKNSSGKWSEPSPPSGEVQLYSAPEAPKYLRATPASEGGNPVSRTAIVNFTKPTSEGIEVVCKDHNRTIVEDGSRVTVAADGVEQTITITCYAINTIDGEIKGGSASTTVTTKGVPATPHLTGNSGTRGSGQAVFKWTTTDLGWSSLSDVEVEGTHNGVKILSQSRFDKESSASGIRGTITIDDYPGEVIAIRVCLINGARVRSECSNEVRVQAASKAESRSASFLPLRVNDAGVSNTLPAMAATTRSFAGVHAQFMHTLRTQTHKTNR